MQKVIKKIFDWLNAFRLTASLERHPVEAVFMFDASRLRIKVKLNSEEPKTGKLWLFMDKS